MEEWETDEWQSRRHCFATSALRQKWQNCKMGTLLNGKIPKDKIAKYPHDKMGKLQHGKICNMANSLNKQGKIAKWKIANGKIVK